MRLAALAVALASLSAFAAEPWDAPPFSADPAALAGAAAALPRPEAADAEVLLEEGTFRYDAQGRETYTYRLVYRVLTAEGAREWATVGVGYAPWHEERPELRARVISPDGRAHMLDPATLVESVPESEQPETFTDRRVLRGPLPAITVGAVVEELIVTRETATLFASGTARRFFLGKSVPVRQVRLTLEVPQGSPLHFVARGVRLKPQRTEEQGRTRLVFEHGPLEPLRPLEPHLPPDAVTWPHVAFSTGRAWGELARRYHETVEAQLAGAGLEKTAREVVGGETRREAVVGKLLAWIHSEVRYTGLQFGEAAFVPRQPAETLVRRYGDCKDLSTLLVGLLRAVGIPANVALLRTDGEDVQPTLPGFGLFDHAIVHVPGPSPLWIDATDGFSPPGQLPLGVQGRLALVAHPSSTQLLRIPEAPSSANTFTTTREVFLSERGPSRIVETKDTTGAIAAVYREHFARTEASRVQEGYAEYARNMFLSENLARLDHRELAALDKPFRVEMELTGARRGFTDDREAAVGLAPFSLLGRLPEGMLSEKEEEGETASGKRQAELLLHEPYQAELRYRAVAPPGYVPRAPPKPFHLKLGPATYSGEYAVKGGEVLATFRFDTGKRRWTARDVDAFREALRPLREEDEPMLFFDHEGAALLAAGRVGEALGAYRKLVALHPQEALHHAHLALALLEAGAGEEARKEARLATALEPSSAFGWRTLGWVLQHDGLGRRFKPGFDHGGALAAYRQATVLDPKDVESRGDLAILFEYDARGERYASGARLDRAIAEYQELRETLERKELDDNLMLDLFLTGRHAEVLKLAPSVAQSSLRDSVRLASAALVEGPAAAARQATRWVTAPEARRTALVAASSRLVALRHYPEAHALLTEAARGAPNAAELQGRLAALAKVTRFDETKLQDDDPRAVVQRLMLELLSEEASEAKVKALFSREVLAEGPEAAREAIAAARRPLRRLGGEAEVPLRVAVDLALGAMELRTDGDPKVGFRVQTQLAAKGGAGNRSWFVVREGGRYRLLAIDGHPPALGLEALRLAEAGDLAGARRWLDWARDALPTSLPEHQGGAGFQRLWTQGGTADRETVRLAAASLVAHGRRAVRAIPLLSAAREKAGTETARRALDRDLAAAYGHAERMPELLEVAERLLEATPTDELAFLQAVQALRELKRLEEATRRVEARLKLLPEDALALEMLASLCAERGDLAGAQTYRRRIVEAGKATAGTYNDLAWTTVLMGKADAAALEDAQRAASLSNYGSAAIVHTLATLYAELGKGPEARQLLFKALELRDSDELAPHDWYVVGRIAEGYGLTETARAAYAKAKSPKPDAESVDALAQSRLKALGEVRTVTPTP
jgi:tetratricopeptide (TPR) repeat protein